MRKGRFRVLPALDGTWSRAPVGRFHGTQRGAEVAPAAYHLHGIPLLGLGHLGRCGRHGRRGALSLFGDLQWHNLLGCSHRGRVGVQVKPLNPGPLNPKPSTLLHFSFGLGSLIKLEQEAEMGTLIENSVLLLLLTMLSL